MSTNFPPPGKRQARVLWFSLTALAVAVLVALLGLFLWCFGLVLRRLAGVLVPMAFALILAYILDPVVEFFDRKKVPRLWSVCLVFVLGILVMGAVLGSVLPGLRRETRKLVIDLPKSMELVRSKTDHFMEEFPLARQISATLHHSVGGPATSGTAVKSAKPDSLSANPTNATDLNQTNATPAADGSEESETQFGAPLSKSAVLALTHGLMYIAQWFAAQLGKVTTWAEFLIGFVLVPVYLFYFLLEKDGITRRWPDYLPIKESAAKDEAVFVLRSINDCMIAFFRGQVLVALCVGVLLAAGYAVMGLNYSVLLGLVAGVLGIVPYLGTIVSLVLALAVAGIQFQDWSHALCVLAIAGVVKLLEDFVISPKIMGRRAGLHPLTIILAVMVGTTLLGGFLGALLAIPLTAALRTLMFRYIWTREHPGKKLPDLDEVEEVAK